MRPTRTRHRAAGLTLVELLLAVAGTALIGAAIAAMLFAATRGTSDAQDMRTLVIRAKTTTGRLGAAIRSSVMILEQGADYLVLWTYDTDGSGTPHLAEIQLIERDGSDELVSYKAPPGLSGAQNTEFALSTNYAATLGAIKGGATFGAEPWATGVTTWSITLDDADPQAARLVSFRFDLQTTGGTETVVGAAALRNDPSTIGAG